eukprot:1926973-Alexandrium_andersonii.AAC.1
MYQRTMSRCKERRRVAQSSETPLKSCRLPGSLPTNPNDFSSKYRRLATKQHDSTNRSGSMRRST